MTHRPGEIGLEVGIALRPDGHSKAAIRSVAAVLGVKCGLVALAARDCPTGLYGGGTRAMRPVTPEGVTRILGAGPSSVSSAGVSLARHLDSWFTSRPRFQAEIPGLFS